MKVSNLLSPICLAIALVMLVTAFAILVTDAPDVSVQLHQARASGDELVEEALERAIGGSVVVSTAAASSFVRR